MLFNSLEFLVFATVFFAGMALLKRTRVRCAYLSIASLTFYGLWEIRYVPILLFVAAVNYLLGLAIDTRRAPRVVLALGVTINVGLLMSFKYALAAVSLLADISSGHPAAAAAPAAALSSFWSLLPIGLSFYSFQGISYLAEIYARRVKPTRNPIHYLAYQSLFPSLLAGPIVRPQSLSVTYVG